MAENFKIRQGLSSDLFDAEGNLKTSVVLELGCWYLCTDTVNVYVCVQDADKLVLKRVNSNAFDLSFSNLSNEIDAIKNKKVYQRLADESELPTDFEASSFDANIIYYIITDVEKDLIKLYLFDPTAKKYFCINKTNLAMLESEDSFIDWLKNKTGLATANEVTNLFKSLNTELEQVTHQIELLDDQIVTLTGNGDNSINKVLSDSKSYTDTRERVVREASQAYTDQAEARLTTLLTEQTITLSETIEENTNNLSKDIEKVSNIIGGTFDEINTIDSAIQEAKDTTLLEIQTLKTTEVASNAQKIAKEISDRKIALAEVTSSLGALDTDISRRLDLIEDWKASVSNILTFIGVSITNPKTDSVVVSGLDTFQKGDVVLYDGKEYVNVTGTNTIGSWEEFGTGSATEAAVELIKNRLDLTEQETQSIKESLTTKVTSQELIEYKDLVQDTFESKAVVAALTQRVKIAEADVVDNKSNIKQLTNSKLDSTSFTEFVNDYNNKVLDLISADSDLEKAILDLEDNTAENLLNIETLQDKIDSLENTYSDTQIDEQINDAVTLEKQRAEAVETQLNERIKTYDNYFSIDGEGNFPSVLIFDCGGAN